MNKFIYKTILFGAYAAFSLLCIFVIAQFLQGQNIININLISSIQSLPFAQKLIPVLKTPPGFILLIGIPAGVFLISQIISIHDAWIERNKKHPADDKNRKILTITLIFLVSAPTFQTKVHALFSAQSQMSGINLSIAELHTPTIPTLISPSDHSLLTQGSTQFEWSGNSNVAGITYEIRLAGNNNFKTIIYERNYIADSKTSFDVDNGSYWWQVRACNDDKKCSSWTDAWKITVIPVSNKNTSLTLAMDKKTNNISFTANDVSEYAHYTYEITYYAGSQLEGISGNGPVNGHTIFKQLYLGTCSGTRCVAHDQINFIHLKIELKSVDGKELVLYQSI